ncbi:hypothetical protein GCM10017744_002690 [Streptomyces antimycoticus]
MAMRRARPTMIRPVRHCGRSGGKSQAKANIAAGPAIQFTAKEGMSRRRSRVTVSRRS